MTVVLGKIGLRLDVDLENPKPSPGAADVGSRGHSTPWARHIEAVGTLVDRLRKDDLLGRLQTRHLECLHSVVTSGNP